MASSNTEHLIINEDQGNFVLSFVFGLEPADKAEYKVIELKISSVEETLKKLKTKLNRYIIKFKKKKRREIRKSGLENPDEKSKEIDDTELQVYLVKHHEDIRNQQGNIMNEHEDTVGQDQDVIDNSLTNDEAFVPGVSLILQFGVDIHRFQIQSLNPPRVKIFKLPAYMMVGYLLYPRVDLDNAEREYSRFMWYRRELRGYRDHKEEGETDFHSLYTSYLFLCWTTYAI